VKTLHLDPDAPEPMAAVVDEVERLLSAGKRVAVTVADEDERVSPREAADRLGFSRQHVVRLIEAGELDADRLPGSNYWQIPLTSITGFEGRRTEARGHADDFSRSLDGLGAPTE
jgi:excisionase family DNA binding protein